MTFLYITHRIKILRMTVRIKKADNQKDFVKIVDKILAAKSKDNEADTSDLEKEIDEMVYELYKLTPEEKEIVRNA